MGAAEEHQDLYGGRGVTLVELRNQQYSLNRQILLALQTHNDAERAKLEAQLAELQKQIDQFCLPGARRRT